MSRLALLFFALAFAPSCTAANSFSFSRFSQSLTAQVDGTPEAEDCIVKTIRSKPAFSVQCFESVESLKPKQVVSGPIELVFNFVAEKDLSARNYPVFYNSISFHSRNTVSELLVPSMKKGESAISIAYIGDLDTRTNARSEFYFQSNHKSRFFEYTSKDYYQMAKHSTASGTRHLYNPHAYELFKTKGLYCTGLEIRPISISSRSQVQDYVQRVFDHYYSMMISFLTIICFLLIYVLFRSNLSLRHLRSQLLGYLLGSSIALLTLFLTYLPNPYSSISRYFLDSIQQKFFEDAQTINMLSQDLLNQEIAQASHKLQTFVSKLGHYKSEELRTLHECNVRKWESSDWSNPKKIEQCLETIPGVKQSTSPHQEVQLRKLLHSIERSHPIQIELAQIIADHDLSETMLLSDFLQLQDYQFLPPYSMVNNLSLALLKLTFESIDKPPRDELIELFRSQLKDFEKSELELQPLYQILNSPGQLLKPLGHSDQRQGKYRYWKMLKDSKSRNWILSTRIRHRSYLSKLGKQLQSTILQPGLKIADDFYFYGLDLCLDFPLLKQDRDMFAHVGATYNSNTEQSFFIQERNGKPILLFCIPLKLVPAYTMILSCNLDALLHNIVLKTVLGLVLFLALVYLMIQGVNKVLDSTVQSLQRLSTQLEQIQSGDLKSSLPSSVDQEFNTLSQILKEWIDELAQKEVMRSFLSRETNEMILSQEEEHLESVTIVFAGILNLETLVKLDASVLHEKVNSFLNSLQPQIYGSDGFVDKFTGNALLGIFRGEKGPENAIKSALEFASIWEDENLKIGIGIATGPVILGSIGSAQRKDFTCIGDTVNTAARLEYLGANNEDLLTITVDESSYQKISYSRNFQFKSGRKVELKGKQEACMVYEIQV